MSPSLSVAACTLCKAVDYKVIDLLANGYVRSYDKPVITRLFSYLPYMKPSATPQAVIDVRA